MQAQAQIPKPMSRDEFFELVRLIKEDPTRVRDLKWVAIQNGREAYYIRIDHDRLVLARAYYNERDGVAELKLVYESGLVILVRPDDVEVYSYNAEYPYER